MSLKRKSWRWIAAFLMVSHEICGFASEASVTDSSDHKKSSDRQMPLVSADTDPLSSDMLWNEIMSQVENPRVYDWRRASFELEVGLHEVDERTVFKSSGQLLGIGIPLGGGLSLRTGVRRIKVEGSRSGDLIERTPFRQPAQPSRYEVYGLLDYSLAEGRAFTRLSPLIGDCEHVLAFEGGGHYTHPSIGLIPRREPESDRVNGQASGYSTFVLHLGFRYTLFLPTGLGVFMAPGYELPLSRIEGPLDHWYTFSFGAVISFADDAYGESRRKTRREK